MYYLKVLNKGLTIASWSQSFYEVESYLLLLGIFIELLSKAVRELRLDVKNWKIQFFYSPTSHCGSLKALHLKKMYLTKFLD